MLAKRNTVVSEGRYTLYVGMARVRSHVIAYKMRPSDSPGNDKLSLKSTPLRFTDPFVAQAMPSKLVDTFVFTLEQIFLIRDFWTFSSSSPFSSSVNDLAP